jgi:hypothetical protein
MPTDRRAMSLEQEVMEAMERGAQERGMTAGDGMLGTVRPDTQDQIAHLADELAGVQAAVQFLARRIDES